MAQARTGGNDDAPPRDVPGLSRRRRAIRADGHHRAANGTAVPLLFGYGHRHGAARVRRVRTLEIDVPLRARDEL